MRIQNGFAVMHRGRLERVSVSPARTISVLGVPTYQWDMKMGERQIACRAPIGFYKIEKTPDELKTTLFGLSSNLLVNEKGTANGSTLTFFQSGKYQYVFRYDTEKAGRNKVITAPRLKTLDCSGSVSDSEHKYLSELGRRVPGFFIAPERRITVDFRLTKPAKVVNANVYPDLVSRGYIEITIIDEEGSLCFNYNALNYDQEKVQLALAGKSTGPKYDLFSPQLARRFYGNIVSLLVAGYSFKLVLGIGEFDVGAGDIVMRKPVSDDAPIDFRCITVRKFQNVSFNQYIDYIRGLGVQTFEGKGLVGRPISELSGFEFSRAVARGLKARYSLEDARMYYKKFAYPHLAQIFE